MSSPTSAAPDGDAGALVAHAVSFNAGGKRLLEAVSTRLTPGRVLAVVGPNGAGKTTLLKLLTGEIVPSAGRVELEGRTYLSWPRRERARRVAVLPQRSTMNVALTSMEVVLLGRIPHAGVSSRTVDLRIAGEALAAMDAAHLSARLFPSLSGGEQSRVHAARVLAQIWERPADGGGRFLLLDEPTAALDYAHQHELLTCVRKSAAANIGVLFVLHDLNLAAQYADDVLLLSDGRVAGEGTPSEVFQAKALSEIYRMPLAVFPHPHDQRSVIAPTVPSA